MATKFFHRDFSIVVVSVVAILAIMVCCLAALGYKSDVVIEKEKIEVSADNSNLVEN